MTRNPQRLGVPIDAAPADHDALPRQTVRGAVPFTLVALVGALSFVLPLSGDSLVEPVVIIAVFLAGVAILVVSLRRTRRTWIDPVAPWLSFLIISVGRDATGGAGSGLGPLVVLPIIWLALVGTRRDLMVAAALTAATFLVPLLLVGPPRYPVDDWRQALLWTAFAVLVGPTIQALVRQLATETHRQRETAAQLHSILRGARLSSIISTDLEGRITSFSVGAEDLTGHRAADVVGVHTLELLHDAAEMRDAARELGVEPGHAVHVELGRTNAESRIWTYVRADGVRRHVRVAVTEMLDPAGGVSGYLSVGIDATTAIDAEDARAQSEERWRLLLDHLPDLTVMMLDRDMGIRAVGGAGAMRHSLDTAVGHSLDHHSNADNMHVMRPAFDEAFQGRETAVELRANSNGAAHQVTFSPLPVGPEGPVVMLIARDVSRERAREREMVRARTHAERLISRAPHGVAILHRDGRVVEANLALLALTGRSESEVVGGRLADLGRAGDRSLLSHLDEAWANRTGRAEVEWAVVGPDREDVHVSLSSTVLHGDDQAADLLLVHLVDVSERRRYELRLAHLADHDGLTGLVNRRRFDEELARHLKRCERTGPRGAVLLLDLDHFKDVNDTLGHHAGDQLIISAAGLLRKGLRDGDVVARLGGDEFAILLPEADRLGATTVAASIVARIRDFTATLDGTYRRVTASIGVVTVQAANEHAADILALADMTMYDAKDDGRDGYVVLEEDSARQPRSGARLEWKGRIERALETGAFQLHLQPILDLRTDTVRSAEVLIRLDDADELVMPSRFLYIAERSGLMPAVDAWVVRRSVALLARLRTLDPGFRLEVNLSGQSIGDPTIERVIVEALEEHRVDPDALILEITETAAVADLELAHQFAERMTILGCKFALDDFGAGFGSFYYLKHLVFDYVKIDGEFVASCHTSAVDRSILRSIIGIAHDLGKRAVAEFVDDPEVLEIVRAEGGDLAQGYLIGKPVPYDDFVAAHLTTTLRVG